MRQLRISKQVTNRDSLSLDKYLYEISKLDLLTTEEEVQLSRKAQTGDQEALDRMVKCNLRFVVSVAKQYQNQGLSLPDLVNEGNIGLIKAVKRFDSTRGFKFISYAVWWIRQAILHAIAEHSRLVRLPLNRIGNVNKVIKTQNYLEQKLLREPTKYEIAEEMNSKEHLVEEAMKMFGHHLSLDVAIGEPNGDTMGDMIANKDSMSPDEHLINHSLSSDIDRFIDQLESRERNIIILFYGLKGHRPHSLDQISGMLGLTRERVRQLREKGLRRLKANSSKKLLKTYMG